jgi:hypothetical protein
LLRSCSAVPACAPESSSPFYGLRFNGSWFSPLPRGRVQHPQRETSASRGRGSWFMVQSFREGFNPLSRGSILSRGVQSSREGFNPLSRGPILSRGVQSSLEGFRGSVSSERDGCLARARVYPPRVSGLKMRSFGAPPFQDKSSPLGRLDLLRFFLNRPLPLPGLTGNLYLSHLPSDFQLVLLNLTTT